MFLGVISIVLGLVVLFFSSKLGVLLLISPALWATVCVSLCLITSGILAVVNRYRPHRALAFGCAVSNAVACVVCAFAGFSFYLIAFFFLLFAYYMVVRHTAIRGAETAEDSTARRA